MKQDELDRLMAEVGDHDDSIVACVKTLDGSFAIRFEDWDVLAEWDDERQRLMLSVEIGTPPVDRVAEIYETLLSYNLLWRATGGVHMGLTGRKGAALQMAELAGAEIAPPRIALVASNLADKAGIWQAYFESETPSREAVPQPAPADHVIRA